MPIILGVKEAFFNAIGLGINWIKYFLEKFARNLELWSWDEHKVAEHTAKLSSPAFLLMCYNNNQLPPMEYA